MFFHSFVCFFFLVSPKEILERNYKFLRLNKDSVMRYYTWIFYNWLLMFVYTRLEISINNPKQLKKNLPRGITVEVIRGNNVLRRYGRHV